MLRRDIAKMLISGSVIATSGCVFFGIEDSLGLNDDLEIINNSPKTAELEITVRYERLGTTPEPIYHQNIKIGGESEKILDILGDNSYRIFVNGVGDSLNFKSSPRCDHARTAIIVSQERELESEVRICE